MTEPADEVTPVLTDDVRTGRETEVRVAGFSVAELSGPPRWDPSTDRLELSYRVFDPNAQIRRGRLSFYRCPPRQETRDDADGADDSGADDATESTDTGPAIGAEIGEQLALPDGDPETTALHTIALQSDELAHGAHTLAEERRWSGDLAGGGRISALDAPVWVRLEVWNRDGDEPPGPDDEGTVSYDAVMVPIDIVVRARWASRSVLPAGDPDEPARGETEIDLKLKNVPDDTPIRFAVTRIVEIDAPVHDRLYDFSGRDASAQPGIEPGAVRGGNVKVSGRNPKLVFGNHAEHWKYPGNNFYALWIQVGQSDRWIPVTERDYLAREREALHMRFMCLLYAASRDNPYRVPAIREIGEVMNRRSKYFHATVLTSPMTTPAEYHRQTRNRYIVVHIGHAYGDCWHADHPTRNNQPIDHPHSGFPPDGLVCPDRYLSPEAEAEAIEHHAEYAWPIQLGCGNPGPYRTIPMVGSGVMLMNRHNRQATDDDYVQVGTRGANRQLAEGALSIEADAVPRFLHYVGGCRTAVSDGLIGWYATNGTRYTHGWVYSVDGQVNASFASRLFRRWIKETGVDMGQDEWDPDRFVEVYAELARTGDPVYYEPRLRSIDERMGFDPLPPDHGEAALG